MRFYKITPKAEPWITSPRVHWLNGSTRGTDKGRAETFYPTACGKSILGRAELSSRVLDVTCADCQSEIAAQVLIDEARLEDLDYDPWTARGGALDCLATDRFGLHRGPGETDADFRDRIGKALRTP